MAAIAPNRFEMDKLYTTNQLAKLFGVVPTTVIDWIERGKLDAFKTLGGHRRITNQAVLDFLHRHRLPYPPAFADSAPKVVVLIADDARRAQIGELFQNDFPHAQVFLESRGAEALMRIGAERPRLVIFEAGGVAGFECRELCRAVRANPALASVKLLAVGSEAQRGDLLSAGADAVLEPSEALQQMAETARALLASRPA